MSRETRIGILTVLVIAASIWGYKFIKGQNLLSSQQFFYVEYPNIGQMQASTPVFNRGLQVGTVTDIYPKPDDALVVVVEMEVNKDFKIPKNTIAAIKQSVMGDKSIELLFNKVCSGNDCANNGDYLKGTYNSIAGSVMSPEELTTYMDKVTVGLKEVSGELTKMIDDPDNVIGKSMSDLQATMSNMKTMTSLLNRELRQNGKVNDILENVNQVTSSIEPGKVTSLVDNANQFTNKMNEMDLKAMTDNTNKTLAEAQAAIAKLTNTMEKADGAIAEFNGLLAKINNGEGTIGKVFQDDQLYEELKTAASNANILMIDVQQRPDRYMPFKSSRKVKRIDRKRPLVLPEEGKN